MYASKRTYPEISFPVVYLASRYNKATKDDYGKAMRMAEYIVGCGENHNLILAPKSLQLTARSDASYAEHKVGRSHTGDCVGFESDTACWFLWLSAKQPRSWPYPLVRASRLPPALLGVVLHGATSSYRSLAILNY